MPPPSDNPSLLEYGTPESGNWGHAGRPNEVGGSAKEGGTKTAEPVMNQLSIIRGKFAPGSIAYHVIPDVSFKDIKKRGLVSGYHGELYGGKRGRIFLFGDRDEAGWYRDVQQHDASQDGKDWHYTIVRVKVGGLSGGRDYTLYPNPEQNPEGFISSAVYVNGGIEASRILKEQLLGKDKAARKQSLNFIREDVLAVFMELLSESDKAISGAVAKNPIMQGQSTLYFSLGMRNQKVMQAGYAAVADIDSGFRAELTDIYAKYAGGTLDFNQAIDRWRSATSEAYEKMFLAGSKASGNPFYDEMGLTSQDQDFIAKAIAHEETFFSKFLIDIKDPDHTPRIPYDKRAMMYADSAKSAWQNGILAGAGENIEIDWVLGPNDNHCDDCVILSQRSYTWETLPTTPRAGDTQCLSNCKCSLNVRRAPAASIPALPGVGVPPGAAWVEDATNGMPIEGVLKSEFDDMYSSMYKARQMVQLADNPADKLEWIKTRRSINGDIINAASRAGVRVTPTVAVSDLVAAAEDAATFGGRLMADDELYSMLQSKVVSKGDEFVLLRGNKVIRGVVRDTAYDYLSLETTDGAVTWNHNTDVLFRMQPQYENISDGELLRRLNATLGEKATELPGSTWADVETSNAAKQLFTKESVHGRFQSLANGWARDDTDARLLMKKLIAKQEGIVSAAYEPSFTTAENAKSIESLIGGFYGTKDPAVVAEIRKEIEQMLRESSFFSQQLAEREVLSASPKILYRAVSDAEIKNIAASIAEHKSVIANSVAGMSDDFEYLRRNFGGLSGTAVVRFEVPIKDILWSPGMKWSSFNYEREWVVRGSGDIKLLKVFYQGGWETLAYVIKAMGL